jgi:hypothetical protein
MHAQTLKQEALAFMERLPENADIDEIIYRLHVLDKLRKSREAIAQNQIISHEDLKRDIEQW